MLSPGPKTDDDKIIDAPPSDDEVGEDNVYVTKDHKNITQTSECSEDSEDDEFTAQVLRMVSRLSL